MLHAETVIFAVCPEIGALKALHGLLDYLNEAGSVAAKSTFVLNNQFAREMLRLRDVENALGDVRHSAELRETLRRRLTTLRRGVELANERYENGYSDYLEVLDTERSLFSAELQLASARGDYQRALVDLYRALGGDWNAVPTSHMSAPTTGASR